MELLLDVNIEYAVYLMGASAWDYLRRNYEGEDPRLERCLEENGYVIES